MRCVLTLTRPWLKLEKRRFINELPCHIVEGHQLTTVVCPNFPILKLCGCPNFNQCGWTSPKEIFGENTGLYPVKMIVLFSSRTNRLQETYIVGNLSLLKPGTIRRGHETCTNQQLIVKGLTPSELCRISPNAWQFQEYLTIKDLQTSCNTSLWSNDEHLELCIQSIKLFWSCPPY